ALNVLLAAKGHLRVDEMRKNIEALPPDAYDRMTYYERWISAIANTLLQRGVLTADELGRKMEEIARREGVSACPAAPPPMLPYRRASSQATRSASAAPIR